MERDTFPRQQARTKRFTLGEPRTFTVGSDGKRVVFCRSRAGDDPINCLWVLDVATGTERLVADPVQLLEGDGEAELTPEEQVRRERSRERAGGIVTYATDPRCRVTAFALAGRLFVAGLISGAARELAVEGPVFDPRPDPAAQRLAYVSDATLRIAELDGSSRVLAADDDPDVSWGLAEFVAAEEMRRARGYWWSPDGERLAATRVDNRPVTRWYLADPTDPAQEPAAIRYPHAGSANASVELFVIDLEGNQTAIEWDRERLPYLVDVKWRDAEHVALVVQTRDQLRMVTLLADVADGTTHPIDELQDDHWVEIVPGVPGWLGDDRLVNCADIDGARRLVVEGAAVTPPTLQVRSVVSIDDDHVVFTANDLDEPTQLHLWRWDESGVDPITTEAGVHQGWAGAGTIVVQSSSLAYAGTRTTVQPAGHTIESFAAAPMLSTAPNLLRLGTRDLRSALFLPTDWHGVPEQLPVLIDSYGGPHLNRVVHINNAHLVSQWLADQGFAVLVTDGRGTPGRGYAWERAIHLDLSGPVLDDQEEALSEAGRKYPELDLTRVGIRGWSFGGYLAALAVLRKPETFHAAVAGAPVTEWRLYDTHYTERYLGDPGYDASAYDRCSLLHDAEKLRQPLLLVHGLADDNVVAAHTLQLSRALMEAGRPHVVLPLAGVTHMASQENVAESLLALEVSFLKAALGVE